MPPLISVIVPTYNRAVLFREALDSVFAQDFTDYEVLVVDDGSTDGTAEMISQYLDPTCSGVPELRYIQTVHTGMPGKVRNTGAAEARGRYLAFLDSDDLWRPEKLTRQIRYMEQRPAAETLSGPGPAYRISHTREIWFRNGREVSQKGQKHLREGYIFRDALKKCIIGPSTVLMERELFDESGGFREDLEIAEDYEFWLRVTCRNPVGYIDEPFTVKRAGSWEQLSEKYGHIEYFRIKGLEGLVEREYFENLREPETGVCLQDLARQELVRKCRIYAAGCRKRGRSEEATRFEMEAKEYGQR